MNSQIEIEIRFSCKQQLELYESFSAETRLTVYRRCPVRMHDDLALDLARVFSHFLTLFISFKLMFFLWSILMNQFLDINFDELSYFYIHDALDSFNTAREVASWPILHDEFFWNMVRSTLLHLSIWGALRGKSGVPTYHVPSS